MSKKIIDGKVHHENISKKQKQLCAFLHLGQLSRQLAPIRTSMKRKHVTRAWHIELIEPILAIITVEK